MPPMRHDQSSEAGRARTGTPGASAKGKLVWLYLPPECLDRRMNSKASRFVLALADWSSASISQNPDIGLYVSSSGKPSLRPPSWPGWKTRPWITRLYGTTLPPSTAAHGAARFISSLEVIPASPSPVQAASAARATQGTCGHISGGLSRKSSPDGVFSRMSKDISIWDPPRSSATFAKWATASKRACSRRLRLALHTFAGGSSLWPTPTRSLYCNRIEMELSEQGLKLRDDPNQTGSQVGIGKAAKLWTMIWLIVTSCAERPKSFNFRSSHPLHLSLTAGGRYSAGDLTFNPNFSDWLMGWPIGWTAPRQPVTEWSAWLQHMRGALSRLPICGGAD